MEPQTMFQSLYLYIMFHTCHITFIISEQYVAVCSDDHSYCQRWQITEPPEITKTPKLSEDQIPGRIIK